MDRADRLIDQDEAVRNSFVQHHVVNGRGSLFPAQGDASRSKLDEVPFKDVMVSYIVDNDVEGLETASVIKYADLTPHHSTMSFEDLAELYKKPQLSRSGELSYMLAKPQVDRHLRLVLPEGAETSVILNDDYVPHSLPPATLVRDRVYEAAPPDVEAFRDLMQGMRDEQLERGRESSPAHISSRRRSQSLPASKPDLSHIQVGSLSDDLRKTADIHVSDYYIQYFPGQKFYKPTSDEVVGELHKIIQTHPWYKGKSGGLSKNKIVPFRLHLRYHKKWKCSLKFLESILLRKLQVVSTGLIPAVAVVSSWPDDELDGDAQDADLLPKRKEKPEKKTNEEWTPEQKLAYKQEQQSKKAEAFQRTQPPKENVHSKLENAAAFQQNTDNTIRLVMRQDPEYKSLIRIEHTINYEDPATPTVQPKHFAHVELTHNNTVVDKSGNSFYRITDVSHRGWEPALRKLYPQTTVDKDYYDKLYASLKRSGHKLVLLQFAQNDIPCTSNLLTQRKDMPPVYDDLRILMKRNPGVFILGRASDWDTRVERIVDYWKDLRKYDPITDAFIDGTNPQLANSAVRATADLTKITVRARFAFENMQEYTRAVGLGTLIEQRHSMGTKVYKGKVAVVPVPTTYNKTHGCYLAYHLQLSYVAQRGSPALVVGNAVTIDFHPGGDAASPHAWKGFITEATDATSMSQLNVIVNRPRDPKTQQPLDLQEYSKLTEKHYKDMKSASTLRTWSRENCVVPVAIFTTNDEDECKRLLHNINDMSVSHKARTEHPEFARVMDELCEWILAKDFTQFNGTPLFDTIEPGQWALARPILVAFLRDYQAAVFSAMEADGIFCNTAGLIGPSGSGKSTLALIIAVAYLLDVRVPDSDVKRNAKEKARIFQKEADFALAKDAKKQAKAEGIELDIKDELKKLASARDDGGPVKQKQAPQDTSNETYSYQSGRVTLCGIQNDTVEETYRQMSKATNRFVKAMGLTPKLIIRLYGKDSELDAVLAMTRPSYNPLGQDTPFNIDPDTKVTDYLGKSVLNAYLAAYRRTDSAGLKDRRMKQVQGSAANYILELAEFDLFPQSPELLATFTTEELAYLKKALSPIINAHRDLRANNDVLDGAVAKSVKAAAQIGYQALIEKAAVICTTSSVATEKIFNVMRQSHAVFLEEAGRANEAETLGYFSHFWNAHLRMFVGSTNQLPPMVFGESPDNPFQKQMELSPLLRWSAAGAAMYELDHTSRFRNQPNLDLCALVNEMPGLQAVAGSFDDEISKKYAAVNMAIWGINSTLIFVNVEGAAPVKAASSSTYCLETACAVMKDAVERMAFMDGHSHVIITPYKAQVTLLERQREYAVQQALVAGKDDLATNLALIRISTVDSFMGKDCNSITIDTTGALGHLMKEYRFLVAATRAKVSNQFFGPTYEYTLPTPKINRFHPLRSTIHKLSDLRHISTLSAQDRKAFEQYEVVLQALGLIASTSDDAATYRIASAHLAPAIALNNDDWDEEELSILAMIQHSEVEIPQHDRPESPVDDTAGGWGDETLGDSGFDDSGFENATFGDDANHDAGAESSEEDEPLSFNQPPAPPAPQVNSWDDTVSGQAPVSQAIALGGTLSGQASAPQVNSWDDTLSGQAPVSQAIALGGTLSGQASAPQVNSWDDTVSGQAPVSQAIALGGTLSGQASAPQVNSWDDTLSGQAPWPQVNSWDDTLSGQHPAPQAIVWSPLGGQPLASQTIAWGPLGGQSPAPQAIAWGPLGGQPLASGVQNGVDSLPDQSTTDQDGDHGPVLPDQSTTDQDGDNGPVLPDEQNPAYAMVLNDPYVATPGMSTLVMDIKKAVITEDANNYAAEIGQCQPWLDIIQGGKTEFSCGDTVYTPAIWSEEVKSMVDDFNLSTEVILRLLDILQDVELSDVRNYLSVVLLSTVQAGHDWYYYYQILTDNDFDLFKSWSQLEAAVEAAQAEADQAEADQVEADQAEADQVEADQIFIEEADPEVIAAFEAEFEAEEAVAEEVVAEEVVAEEVIAEEVVAEEVVAEEVVALEPAAIEPAAEKKELWDTAADDSVALEPAADKKESWEAAAEKAAAKEAEENKNWDAGGQNFQDEVWHGDEYASPDEQWD